MTTFTRRVVQRSRSTVATFNRSLSIDETPCAVLMTVGHSEQSATVSAEVMNDFSSSGSGET